MPVEKLPSYDELLERAYTLLPERVRVKERFEIPPVRGHFQGNRTIITNFGDIAQTLRRDPEHMVRYLTKALAAPMEVQGNLLIIGRKIKAQLINQKIDQYAKLFVICPECGKPDTVLVKEDRIVFLRCQACGAKHPVPERV